MTRRPDRYVRRGKPRPVACPWQVGALRWSPDARSALRFLRRQLVNDLRSLAFHHGPHFVRDMVDAFDIEHVLVQPFQVRRRHYSIADDAGLIHAGLFSHCRLLVTVHAYQSCWVARELQGATAPRYKIVVLERAGPQMLTEEDRALVLSVWAALVSVVAIYSLIGSFWKAALIGAFVGVLSLLGYGTRWVLKGSFAIAVLAIAVALGLPPPDHWLQLIDQVQEASLASRAGG
jgi:hypothetical protein